MRSLKSLNLSAAFIYSVFAADILLYVVTSKPLIFDFEHLNFEHRL